MTAIRRVWANGAGLLAVMALVTFPARAGADGLLAAFTTGVTSQRTLFPNWLKVPVAEFTLQECDDVACAGCTDGPIVGLTIYNFGSCAGGAGGDVDLYFRLLCGGTDSGTLTMTYDGLWTYGKTPRAAWTWAGSIPWTGGDPWGKSGCAGGPTVTILADVKPCPTDGCSIEPVLPAYGIADACGFYSDWNYDAVDQSRLVNYVNKVADRTIVAPADTLTYTVYYGLPGTNPLTGITVTDSLPADVTYLAGSAVPAPDAGWGPDLGPPKRLRWSLGGGATTGGPTREITFSVSVNWGNETFEPGSGVQGAVEGSRLGNRATVEFLGASCAPATQTSGEADATVRRYLVWNIGDNDLLFAPKFGQPADEMIYEIFIRNESSTRTWHGVEIWDTVPAELTVWGGNYGFEDGCLGWTMTPSGCAAGGPSWYASGPGTDVLRWTLDLPPGATLTLRWRAQVKAAGVTPGDTALNHVSIMSRGQAGVGGDGSARAPRAFVHLAPIVLRTTYFSYVGHSASNGCSGCFLINFYPLNKATDFEFRKLEYNNVPYATTGGVSASINTFVGTCVAGFAESMGGSAGCKVERAPAQYRRDCSVVTTPYTFGYKVTGNAPILWSWMWCDGWSSGDSIAYIPSTSLSFSGFTLYTWRRRLSNTVGEGDSNILINTSVDAYGNYNPNQGTLALVFKWDPVGLRWNFVMSGDIAGESLWLPIPGTLDSQEGHYKFISSDTKMIVWQGFQLPTGGQADHATMVPNGDNGLLVSQPGGPANFYPITKPNTQTTINVGNVEPGNPTNIAVWKYTSNNPVASPGVPAKLAGTAGSWRILGFRSVGAGLNDPANGWIGGAAAAYDNLLQDPDNNDGPYKVEFQSGGRIQVHAGGVLWDGFSGGCQLHGSDGLTAPGQEFWIHQSIPTNSSWCGKSDSSPYNVQVFCPSTGMVVNAESGGAPGVGGAFASYTTTGPDQMVCFMGQTQITGSGRRNWRFWLDPGGSQGDLIALYGQCRFGEKFYTAPFLSVGTHYNIVAPPVVYSGQSFWITVIVLNNGGATKTDYCATSSFTATDPNAKIEGGDLGTYTYPWSSSTACADGSDEDGVRIFYNVTFTQLGPQGLVISDIIDGSITGLASLLVVGADIKLFKEPKLAVAASGDTVTFKVCWSNYSSASGFSLTVTDAVPVGTDYVPDPANAALCGATDPVTVSMSYSTDTTSPATVWNDISGAASPPPTTRWLRWIVSEAGVQTTGCLCYRVSVQ